MVAHRRGSARRTHRVPAAGCLPQGAGQQFPLAGAAAGSGPTLPGTRSGRPGAGPGKRCSPGKHGPAVEPGVCHLHVRLHGAPEGGHADASRRGEPCLRASQTVWRGSRNASIASRGAHLRCSRIGDPGHAAARGDPTADASRTIAWGGLGGAVAPRRSAGGDAAALGAGDPAGVCPSRTTHAGGSGRGLSGGTGEALERGAADDQCLRTDRSHGVRHGGRV